MKGLKKASQFYHLAKGVLRNKEINENCKLNILKIYFKRIWSRNLNKKRG